MSPRERRLCLSLVATRYLDDKQTGSCRRQSRTCIYITETYRLRRFGEAPWETASPCSCHRMRLLLLLRLFVLFCQRNNIRIHVMSRLTEVTPPAAGLQGPGARPAGSSASEQGLKTAKKINTYTYIFI